MFLSGWIPFFKNKFILIKLSIWHVVQIPRSKSIFPEAPVTHMCVCGSVIFDLCVRHREARPSEIRRLSFCPRWCSGCSPGDRVCVDGIWSKSKINCKIVAHVASLGVALALVYFHLLHLHVHIAWSGLPQSDSIVVILGTFFTRIC